MINFKEMQLTEDIHSKNECPTDERPTRSINADTITAFSVLDTGRGVVESYYFDTSKPDSEVVICYINKSPFFI